VIVVIFVPHLLAFNPLPGAQAQGSGPGGGGGRALQITPAAALSVQQAVPQFHQLIAIYSPNNGYYLCVPKTSSTSCDQAIFVDQPTDTSLPSDPVLTEIDRLG
jgi:hypothetical protein